MFVQCSGPPRCAKCRMACAETEYRYSVCKTIAFWRCSAFLCFFFVIDENPPQGGWDFLFKNKISQFCQPEKSFLDSPRSTCNTAGLALARQQFGCPSLTGVALEDSEMVCTSNAHSLTPNLQAPRNSRAHPHANDYCNTHHQGAGSHWEARLLGPEILSYGMNSGKSPRTLQQPDSKARVGSHPEPERTSPFTRFHRRGVPQQPHLGLLRRHQPVSGQLQHGRAFTRGVRLHG